ncbi:MAG: acyltransferase [Microthrixaceae bacterium]
MTRQGAPSKFTSQAPRLGFVGGFDGVRGIGILMVLFNHAYSDLSPSFAGIIDVFFVMSAFLIVTLLLQEHRDHDHIDMRKFYARRVVRLLPSAYLCILAWIVFCLLFDRDRLIYVLQDAAAAVTYIYNLIFPVGLGFVSQSAASHRSIDQFWSLAVEEQFYLLIAITVLVCLRKKWMTQLAIAMVVIAAAIGLARWTGNTGPWPLNTPTNSNIPARGISLLWLSRYDSLMWGVALAVLNARLPEPLPERWRRWLPRVGAVGLVVASVMMILSSKFLWESFGKYGVPYPYVPMSVGLHHSGKGWIQFGHTATALAFAPALLAMARCKSWKGNVWLSWKPLRFLGRMSYTVYVWHTLFYFLVLDWLGGNEVLGQKWRAPILAAIAVVCSLPIFYGVEQRMLRVKLRFASEKEVLDLNTGKMISVEQARAQSKGEAGQSKGEAGERDELDRG